MASFEQAFAEYARVMGSTCISSSTWWSWAWATAFGLGSSLWYMLKTLRLEQSNAELQRRLDQLEEERFPVARKI